MQGLSGFYRPAHFSPLNSVIQGRRAGFQTGTPATPCGAGARSGHGATKMAHGSFRADPEFSAIRTSVETAARVTGAGNEQYLTTRSHSLFLSKQIFSAIGPRDQP